jgi:exopolyphosphatase/guanosine-5'-triphosphate,3'-diphosphate pyrophosphatase
MNERIGIIDLGSNTTRLIVMAYQPQYCFKLIDEVSETVRLAQGIGEDGQMQPEAMYRSVEALKMFHALCQGTGVPRVMAVGTSAVRDATNQDEFLAKLKREAGLEMRVLSGQEEAYYGYLGVVNTLPVSDGFVIDIGGGSTEITEVCERTFNHWVSHPAGTVRYTERYTNSDPISNKDFRALKQAAAKTFGNIDWLQAAPGRVLVGVGGTVRNLARIDQKRRRYPLERLHGYVMTRKSLDSIVDMLRKKDLPARQSVSGLNSSRADVIVAGAVILQQVMHQANFEEILISGQGLREGLFYEYFLQHQEEPLFPDVRSFGVYNLARLYEYEIAHTEKVRELSQSLFDQLQPIHGYGAWERELLGYAAIIHDIGVQVAYYDHHKHSAYLLLNTALPGFTHREVALMTVMVRSHRKGDVKTDEYKGVFEDEDELRAERLSAILRLAEFLERSKSQAVHDVNLKFEGDMVRILLYPHENADLTVEIWNARRKASLFEKAFGRTVEIVSAEPIYS